MPEFTLENRTEPIKYATEEEVLAFANEVREAGGGDLIDALMPSLAGSSKECLIANALNFECAVYPRPGLVHENGEFSRWVMGSDNAIEIAEKLDLDLDPFNRIKLPRLIGNAAHAFDEATDGWTLKYRKEDA